MAVSNTLPEYLVAICGPSAFCESSKAPDVRASPFVGVSARRTPTRFSAFVDDLPIPEIIEC